MDDVAAQLGMSKKTIYQYYEDKNAIINAIAHHELHAQITEMDKARKTATNSIDEIFKMMNCISRTFVKINPNVFYDMQKFHPASWKLFHDFKEKKIMNFVEVNLKDGIKQGLYRADLNIKIMAKFRVEEVAMVFKPEIFPPVKYNIKDVQLILLDHFVHGISTLKGHKLINKYKHLKEED